MEAIMSLIKKENWWEETRTFKKTIKEEYLNIDESLIELEKNSNIVRLELNAIELPLFSKDTKRVKNQIKVYHFKVDKSSFLEVEAPANYSIPGEFEERIFIALTKIMKNNNYSRKFVVSANDILENLGLSNKAYYKRIKEALLLLSKTNYTFTNSLYSNKESGIIEKQIVSSIMNITIISKKDKKAGEIEFFEDGRIKEVYEISFTDYFYDNIIRRGYLAFDSEKLLSIDSSVARSIYTMLEKWRGYDLFIKRPIFFIARRIPLSWDKKNIARTIKIIEKALINLKDEKVIKHFIIIKNKKWELAELEISYDESHNKTKRETFFTEKNEFISMEMLVTSTEEKIKCISEDFQSGEISEILNMFPEKVLEMKTFENFIKNSVEKHGFDYVKGTAEYTVLKKPKSYKSYLTKALEENWADEYIASKKAKENKKIRQEAKVIEEAIIVEEKPIENLYVWEDFIALNPEYRIEVEAAAYQSFLIESNALDNKIMRNIFEKSKKSMILKIMSEYKIPKGTIPTEETLIEKAIEIQMPLDEKKEILSEIVGEYVSVTEFMLKVREIMRLENLEINFKDLVEVFKLFGEYEDKFIKIIYDEGSKQGIINIK